MSAIRPSSGAARHLLPRFAREKGKCVVQLSLPVCPVADAELIHLAAFFETIEAEAAVELMLFVMGDRVGEAPAGSRRRLEALVAPAAVEIEIADVGSADKGASVGRHILDAAPMPDKPQPRNAWHQCHRAFGNRLDLRELAALGIGVEAVNMAAEDEPALIGLREIEELGAEGKNMIDKRLDRLRHEGLQDVALDRKPQARHSRHMRGMAGDCDAGLAGEDAPARGLDA